MSPCGGMTIPEPGALPSCMLGSGYRVTRILNGAWQLSEGHRRSAPDPEATVEELLRLADAGLTAFDCGDIYIGVEEILGRLVRRVADRGRGPTLRIHTKFVPDRDSLAALRREDVARIVERSLRRLAAERLDMVQLAWWDYSVPGYVEAAIWLDELRRAGKIRLLGATNFDVPRLAEILDAGVPLAAHQVQYSLLDRRPERGMVALCRRRGIPLLSYGSLGGGFLSARWLGLPAPEPPLANRSLVKYRLIINEMGGWNRFQSLLVSLQEIGDRHRVSIANVAVAWVLDRPGLGAVIVGAPDARHLGDSLRSLSFALSEEDRELLSPFEGVGPPGDVFEAERRPDSPHAAIMRYNLGRV